MESIVNYSIEPLIGGLIFLLLTLAGCGWYYSKIKTTKPNLPNFLLNGFLTTYVFFCVIYFIGGVIFSAAMTTFIVFVGIYGVAGLILFCVKKTFCNYSGWLILLLSLTAIVVIPQFLLGSMPFIVSDSWTHIGIVNRMMNTNLSIIESFSMPNDNYGLRFSPHHAFLASVAIIGNVNALQVFQAARLIYPIVLILSFLMLCTEIEPRLNENKIVIFIVGLFFSMLFDVTDAVWRGSADYRIISFILMFVVLRLLYRSIVVFNRIDTSTFLTVSFLSFAIAQTHSIELPIIALMFIPYGFYISILSKNRNMFIDIAILSMLFIMLALFAFFLANVVDSIPLNKNMSYVDFLSYYSTQLGVHVGYYVFTVSVVVLILEKLKSIYGINKSFTNWSLFTLFVSIFFGPLNPIFFPIYSSIIGSFHSNRIMYVFPYYLVIAIFYGICILYIYRNVNTRRLFIFILLFSAPFVTFYNKTGFFDGRLTYKSSDKLSQLYLYPDAYKFIANNLKNKVILSDVFTSAPIPAISDNYIFTHRPWTDGGRTADAREIMKDPITGHSITKICNNKIDIIIINKSNLPEALRGVFTLTPWLYDDFSTSVEISDISAFDGFSFIDQINGLYFFSVNKDHLCMTSPLSKTRISWFG